MVRGWLGLVLVGPLLACCAGLAANNQGPLQPQAVSGPCQVKNFFLLRTLSVPAEESVRNTGEACVFTLINPALNAVITAALVSKTASHGQASAGLISGNRQAVVAYTPQPGFVGEDSFSVTLEPGATGMTVKVTVR